MTQDQIDRMTLDHVVRCADSAASEYDCEIVAADTIVDGWLDVELRRETDDGYEVLSEARIRIVRANPHRKTPNDLLPPAIDLLEVQNRRNTGRVPPLYISADSGLLYETLSII